MNKLLTKIVNDEKFAKGIILGGVALQTISNLILFTGVYYMAVRKGFELAEGDESDE